MKKLICLTVIVMALTITGNAFASPIYCPLTNHSYEAIAVGTTWTTANAAANSYGPGDTESYLAVINSQAENDWIWANLGGSKLNHYWLGGIQAVGALGPRDGWAWVNGDSWVKFVTYENWDTVEPNDWNKWEERYLQFSEPNSSVHNIGLGKWNDALNNAASPGYIVESHAIPEPTSVVLLGMGLVGIAGRFIRRKFMA